MSHEQRPPSPTRDAQDEQLPVPVRPSPRAYRGPAGGMAALVSTTRHVAGKGAPLRATRALLRVNQKGGFDCPGCAWPEPDHRSVAEFCENGAKAIADEATGRRADRQFFARHDLAELQERSDQWLNDQGRLVEPMIRRPGQEHYMPIAWGEAFAVVAHELGALSDPNEAIFYTSGRTSNEAAFLYQLFVRMFGTNNFPDCSNMCHESSGTGMGEALGVGKGTVQLSDFELADVILVLGQNPGSNHPRMLSTLQQAARRGACIISVNPLKEPGLLRFSHPQELWAPATSLSRHYLQVRINGDVALLKGLMKVLLAEEAEHPGAVLDRDFLDGHTEGFEALREDLEATSWADIEASSGIGREAIEEVGRIIAKAGNMIACWAMGLTQHENGVANIQQVVNLLLLRGFMGRPGSGACPVRGHSNVQGDRTMGIVEKPTHGFLDRLGQHFGFVPPREHGHDTIAAIEAMRDGRAQVFVAMGGNFASATPDTPVTLGALSRCRLTVHIATKLNRSHVHPGQTSLLLPCLGRTERDIQATGEQFVTVEDSMSVVHSSRGQLEPAGPALRSEPAIVAGMAQATLGRDLAVDWQGLAANYDRIREAIEAVIPGFERFNERVRDPRGFVLPNGARERRFATAPGKARLFVHPIPANALGPEQLLMMTIRSHDQ